LTFSLLQLFFFFIHSIALVPILRMTPLLIVICQYQESYCPFLLG
jgi:hypothetical protein